MAGPIRAPLWTAAEAEAALRAAGLEGRAVGDWSVRGISIDSRSLEPGELFVALRGEERDGGARDGHDFAAAALERGAAALLVGRLPEGLPADTPRLEVADTLDGLRALARAARARTRALVIGVTGSVGKTSTKEILRAALSPSGSTHASIKSFNNHWGVPLSLSRMPADRHFAVFEMGMNHPGEITPLTRMVRPHIAIVTTVEAVHLEFFDDVAGIARAKAEIFEGLEPGGTAVINADNEWCSLLRAAAEKAGAARIVTFGRAEDADARLLKVSVQPDCTVVVAQIRGRAVTYKVGASGQPWAMNSLAALAAVDAAGADLGRAALALAEIAAPTGRGARHQLALADGELVLIDDAYNASPASIRAALEVLGAQEVGPRGRRIAVLGDMRELGPAGPELHAGLADAVVEAGIDMVFTAGPLMRHLFDALPATVQGRHAADSAALAPHLLPLLRAGDVVTVKGSLGSRMGPIVEQIQALAPEPAEAGAGGQRGRTGGKAAGGRASARHDGGRG
ncbi:UDP-N-acetylmuramoylalanyl-D-glutamyl-2,6-diaminopimelate--D-alanyl-D-alanine ligase [Marinibaculum pumilum]|uniref:UDP-N-acetylmuramoyl-tripeptide--D-alanyl-D-alanine ligase n=1 Tax=Marinibaculum pumilum TaxID=1766165 RepID=A0ABV7L0E3_9PROT